MKEHRVSYLQEINKVARELIDLERFADGLRTATVVSPTRKRGIWCCPSLARRANPAIRLQTALGPFSAPWFQMVASLLIPPSRFYAAAALSWHPRSIFFG